ncbi:MAG: hypothetical protein ACPHLL_00100 [Porticoccaceae bacterium]
MISSPLDQLKDASPALRLRIKLVVYSLLLINFALYVMMDWTTSGHTLYAGSTLLDWTRAFAVTIEESAWITMLALFEVETYLLAKNALSHRQSQVMQLVRIVCYLSLGHTLYAYSVYLQEINSAVLIQGVNSLCQLVEQDVSYAYNLLYTEVTADNCATLSTANQFYYIDPPTFFIVQDSAGLDIELQHAWVDLAEITSWLLILFCIEVAVRLQDRGIVGGPIILVLARIKLLLYSVLWLFIIFWLSLGHYMFAWDEFVWIAGFFVIEMNMRAWRKQIIEANQAA